MDGDDGDDYNDDDNDDDNGDDKIESHEAEKW